MDYRTYQAALPYYRTRFGGRALNPVAVANPEWMEQWFALYDQKNARVDEYRAQGRYDWVNAFLAANPVVPITEESVQSPVPPMVEVPDPALLFDVDY